MYVADAETLAFKWHAHLDLSTDAVSFRAYVYSSPTLADVNGDGRAEIVVGTSVGFLYVLDGSDGSCLRGWPKQMGEIQGQVAALDLDGSGEMALVAADTRGSVAAFSGRTGEELWERHLASLVANGVVAGDESRRRGAVPDPHRREPVRGVEVHGRRGVNARVVRIAGGWLLNDGGF